jgi:hypothetical protein
MLCLGNGADGGTYNSKNLGIVPTVDACWVKTRATKRDVFKIKE